MVDWTDQVELEVPDPEDEVSCYIDFNKSSRSEGVDLGSLELGRDLGFLVPGRGDRPDSCGAWQVKGACEVCGSPIHNKENCKGMLCPNCWLDWLEENAINLITILWVKKLVNDGRLFHVSYSPLGNNEDGFSLKDSRVKDVQGLFDRSYEVFKHHDDVNGVSIFHPYRLKDSLKNWSDVQRNNIEVNEDLVKFNPHVHGVTFVDGDYKETDPEFLNGDVFHRISDSSSSYKDIRSLNDLVKLVVYVLSHAGRPEFPEGDRPYKVVRQFGSLRMESPESIAEGSDIDPDRVREDVRKKVEKKLISLYPLDYVPDNSNIPEELKKVEDGWECPVCEAEDSFRLIHEFFSLLGDPQVDIVEDYEHGWDLKVALYRYSGDWRIPPPIKRDVDLLWHDIGIEIGLRDSRERVVCEEELVRERINLYLEHDVSFEYFDELNRVYNCGIPDQVLDRR